MEEEKIVKPIVSEREQETKIVQQAQEEKAELIKSEEVGKLKEKAKEEETEKESDVGQVRRSDSLTLKGHYMADPIFHEVVKYLGLKPHEYDIHANKISVIVDWAVNHSQSTRAADILIAIKQLEQKLPTPGYGERRYAILYRYVRLLGQQRELNKKIQAYEK